MSLEQELSSEDESTSEKAESENETCEDEDIGIFEEALDGDGEFMGDSSEEDVYQNIKDPAWNVNMEEAETDSSDDDELVENEVQQNTSQDGR